MTLCVLSSAQLEVTSTRDIHSTAFRVFGCSIDFQLSPELLTPYHVSSLVFIT